jgi:Zn-finger nucleic acid-binding protein
VELGKDGGCRVCRGVWLDEERVHEKASRELEFTGGGYSERHCPMCDEKMDEPLVYDVPVDRCAAHGLWFDRAELDKVIERSRSEAWRKYGGAEMPPAKRTAVDPVTELVDAVRVWRRKG